MRVSEVYSNRSILARYSYDAWGKRSLITGSDLGLRALLIICFDRPESRSAIKTL